MELDLLQIKKITFGAYRVEKGEKGFSFFRMSENHSKIYREVDFHSDDNFYKKSKATASVFFDFVTDSKNVVINYIVGEKGSSKNICRFSYLLNGEKKDTFGLIGDRIEGKEDTYKITLDGKLNRITVFFPCLYGVIVKSVVLDDGATVNPVKKNGKILVIGDSISQGYVAESPCGTYVNRLIFKHDYDITNLSIGGARTEAKVLDGCEEYGNYGTVLVALGTNDWENRSKALIIEKTTEFYRKLSEKFKNKRVFALLPLFRTDYNEIKDGGNLIEFNKTLREIIEKNDGIRIIDAFDYIPKSEDMFYDEYLHPNEEGFSYYAENLDDEIFNS